VKFAILSHTHTLKYIRIHLQVYFTRQRKFESEIPSAFPFSFSQPPLSPLPFSGFHPHPPSRLCYSGPFFVYFLAFKCFTVSFLSLSVRSFHLLAPASRFPLPPAIHTRFFRPEPTHNFATNPPLTLQSSLQPPTKRLSVVCASSAGFNCVCITTHWRNNSKGNGNAKWRWQWEI